MSAADADGKDEYRGQINSIQQIFAEYDFNGSGKVRVERVPDLIVNLGRDLQAEGKQ